MNISKDIKLLQNDKYREGYKHGLYFVLDKIKKFNKIPSITIGALINEIELKLQEYE